MARHASPEKHIKCNRVKLAEAKKSTLEQLRLGHVSILHK